MSGCSDVADDRKEADIIVGKTEEEEQSKSGRTRGNASAGRYGAASLAAQKVKST